MASAKATTRIATTTVFNRLTCLQECESNYFTAIVPRSGHALPPTRAV